MTLRPTYRCVAFAALASAAVFALTACEKPGPGVSVFSGTSTEHNQALCWSFSGETLEPDQCAQDVVEGALAGRGVSSIPIIPGSTVGISVDPTVADAGWVPVIGSQRLVETPITSTYFRFAFPDLQEVPPSGVSLQIVAGSGEITRGIWVFRLIPNPGVG